MIPSSRILACAALALATAATPVLAQSKKELVTKLLALQQPGVEQLARTIAERPAAEMTMAARQYMQNVPAEKRESVVKAIDADLKKYADEAIPLLRDRAIALSPSMIGAELESNFNEAELKQLINWFESPVIRRYNQLIPGMQRSLSEKLVEETRGQIEPKLKTLESSMARNLGLPPPGSAAPAQAPAQAPAGAAGNLPGNRK
jgi:hypothetical protein